MKRLSMAALAALLTFSLGSTAFAGEHVPAGTVLNTVLTTQTDLSTKSSQVGDGFTLRVTSANDGDRNFEGAVVRGHVAAVRKAGQGRSAVLTLAFDSIVYPGGRSAPLYGTVTKMGGKFDNTVARQALGAGVGAAVGSQTIGRIIGGAAGGVVGILGGAAGGLAYARNNKANYDLAPGQTVTIQTTSALNVPRRQAGQ